MASKILWIDDEYNRYDDLVSPLKKEGIVFDHASSYYEGKNKLKTLGNYDLLILDIILPEGRNYTEEEIKEGKCIFRPYWGLVLLEEILAHKESKPEIIVLTIVEDRRVHIKLRQKINKKKVRDVLRKGILSKEDVYEAVRAVL